MNVSMVMETNFFSFDPASEGVFLLSVRVVWCIWWEEVFFVITDEGENGCVL